MSASSAITSIVYSLLQKPYLKARLRKELTWLFNSTERSSHGSSRAQPLSCCSINELVEATPLVDKTMLQMAEVVDPTTVTRYTEHTPHFVRLYSGSN